MKKILLISNHVYHYRIKIYNRFYHEFKKLGYEFHVLSNSFQEVDFNIHFVAHTIPFAVRSYIKQIQTINPDIVINFLHLKDRLMLPITLYCRYKKIPAIYWGHGINLKDSHNFVKNSLYRIIHNLSSALILYTPNELKHISPKNRKKSFIAYNTLDFSSSTKVIIRGKNAVKDQYGIRESFVVMFISRIVPYKGLDILLDILSDTPQIGLVIVGKGINDMQKKIVENTGHFYYLGEMYGTQVDEIYNMGDVFSTPGHIGLALNQAFYWGKPVLVLNRHHAPEIYYMKNGETGFIVETPKELKEKIVQLYDDKSLLATLSDNAKRIAGSEMTIEKMFEGFTNALNICKKS